MVVGAPRFHLVEAVGKSFDGATKPLQLILELG
jgi:hypothetical protein